MTVTYRNQNGFEVRPGTYDVAIIESVCLLNEYRLPADMSGIDLVIDIGAHIGAFTRSVLARGAKRVIAIEADSDNFELLRMNTVGTIANDDCLTLLDAAVWRSDQTVNNLALGTYPMDESGAVNTGGARLEHRANSILSTLSLDDLLRTHVNGNDRVVLKLDCEGAEWPILLTCSQLDKVYALCGEYHVNHDPEFASRATDGHLRLFLQDAGFDVNIEPFGDRRNNDRGKYWAVRPA